MRLLFEPDMMANAIEAVHVATAIYTRDPVVNRLLDELAWPTRDGMIVDTSCGDGAFLVAAIDRVVSRGVEAWEDVARRVEGWEFHPGAAMAARERVAETMTALGFDIRDAERCAGAIIKQADFLADGPPDNARYGAIVGNPPYLRMALVPPILRQAYEAVVPPFATADLLHSFLARCAKHLAPGGRIATVAADRLLMNANAAQLREHLGAGHGLGIASLARLDESSSFYIPKTRRKATPARVHPVALVLEHRVADRLTKEPVYPGAEPDDPNARRLEEIARIRLAPWLGTPGIFVVDAITARRLPQENLIPAVDTDDIVGTELREPTRYAIVTRAGETPAPEVLRHLDAHLARMAQRGRRNPRWLPPETFTTQDLSEPCLLIPRIVQRLKPVRVPPGVLAINHNLTVVRSGAASLDEIAGILRSEEATRWIGGRAARLENGYLSVTTTLLRRLPIPNGT